MPQGSTQPEKRPDGPPRNPALLKLIHAKQQWHYRPDQETLKRGFRGWHERGYVPHFDAPNVTQLVTFMLDDSFPVTRRAEWEPILCESDESIRRRRLESWLDRGHGECWLGRPNVARCVQQILRAKDGQRYRLQAWVLMPNHAHLVVDVWETPLSRLLNDWKGASSREANKILDRRGRFWQPDYFDTLIRNGEHLQQSIRYVENNPTKACLTRASKDWPWSSARWRDACNRLPWQRKLNPEAP